MLCDGSNFPNGAFRLVQNFYSGKEVLVTGVFLNATQYSRLWLHPVDTSGDIISFLTKGSAHTIAKSGAVFAEMCEKAHLQYNIHQHDDFDIAEVQRETGFADAMFMSSEVFFHHFENAQPNRYTKMILHHAKCPVVLVPEEFTMPEKIILSYDGSEESIYAIKQFACLFPEWCDKDAQLVYANNKGEDIPHDEYIKELAGAHFSRLTFSKLPFDGAKYFSTWISEEKNSILVSGSFTRPGISSYLKQSFITGVVANHQIPVFIAHA